MSTPDKLAVTKNGTDALSALENGLYAARMATAPLEAVIQAGLKAGMIDCTQCVLLMAACGKIHGAIAAIEADMVYPLHIKLTKVAKDSDAPPAGGYAIIHPLDGGGGR